MKPIITCDKPWVYEFDMGASQQSTQWRLEDEPKEKKKQIATRELKAIRLAVYQRHMDKRVKRSHTFVFSEGCIFWR